MGTAIHSLGELHRLLTTVPAAAGLVALIAVGYQLANTGLGLIPFVGDILATVVFVFALGAMYAVTNTAAGQARSSFDSAIELLAARWLSLLAMTALLLVIFLVVGFVGALMLVVGAIAGGPAGILFVALLGVVVFLPVAMVVQFFVPAIAIDHDGAIDAVGRAVEVVRRDPVSAAGFTLVRWTLEWGPLLLGTLAAGAIGRDGVRAIIDEFTAAADDPGAQPAPASELELLGLVLAETGPIVLATMVLLVVLGGVIGQVLRVFYTTSFYRTTLDRSSATS